MFGHFAALCMKGLKRSEMHPSIYRPTSLLSLISEITENDAQDQTTTYILY